MERAWVSGALPIEQELWQGSRMLDEIALPGMLEDNTGTAIGNDPEMLRALVLAIAFQDPEGPEKIPERISVCYLS